MSASPQCPKCSAPLKDDYGMVTCDSCGTILLVDMEGVAHVESEQPAEAVSDFVSPEQATEQPAEAVQDIVNEMPSWEVPSAVEEAAAFDSGDLGSLGGIEPLAEPAPMVTPEADESDAVEVSFSETPAPETLPEEPQDFNMDALLGYQEPAQEPVETGEAVDLAAPAGDPLGLNEYANSELSQAKDGMLVFRLLISGIDSKEIRESIREAMEDARFGWDTASMIGQIDKGKLVIENVSPVKATILINRIKRLPIQIRWEQYAITQLEDGSSF